MAATGEIRAGRAYVELATKDKTKTGLDAVKARLESFGRSLTRIGAATGGIGAGLITPLVAASKVFASMGDEVNKASDRTGVAVENLSALKYAGEQSAVAFGDLEKSITKMQKTVVEAASGSKGAAEALSNLGLSVSDLQALSPDAQFKLIADRIHDIQDPAIKAAAAMEIFGKSGAGLLPLFANGAKGIEDLEARARALALTFSKEDAAAATLFGDTLGDLWAQLKAVTFQGGAAVAQALQPFAEAATTVLAAVIGWIKQNRGLVAGIFAVGVALVAAGGALIALGFIASGVAAGITALTAVAGVAAAVLAALVSPIGILTTVLVGFVGAILQSTGALSAAVDFVTDKFKALFASVKTAFAGVADALSSGDIELAGRIAMQGLAVVWREGTQEIRGLMADVAVGVVTIWQDLGVTLGNLWDGMVGSFVNLWNRAIGTVAKGINVVRGLWDSDLDVEAANDAIDQDNDAGVDDRKKLEAERAAARKAARDAAVGSADAAAKAELGKLAEMRKELEDLRLEAGRRKDAKNAADEKDEPAGAKAPALDFDDLLERREKAEKPGKSQNGSAGIFNPAALNALAQGGGVWDRIARAAEDTKKNTKKIADAGGLRW